MTAPIVGQISRKARPTAVLTARVEGAQDEGGFGDTIALMVDAPGQLWERLAEGKHGDAYNTRIASITQKVIRASHNSQTNINGVDGEEEH